MFPDSKRAIEGRSDRQAGDETESVSSPLAMARAVADANAGGNANTQRNELDELPPPPYQYDSTSTQISRTEEASNPTTPVEASKETATPAQQSPTQSRYYDAPFDHPKPISQQFDHTDSEVPSYEDAAAAAVAAREASGVPVAPGSEKTEAQFIGDGRIQMHIKESPLISSILAQALDVREGSGEAAATDQQRLPQANPTSLNIVMHVVGSRGDVQPFVALAHTLQQYGHRVRLATHPCFQGFVEDNGVEFFSIGGDPAKLMAFMVKNPGLIPGIGSVAKGEIAKRQREMHEILIGCWRSCYEAGNGLGPPLSEDFSKHGEREGRPFIADAIIANPPSSAHVHCAEKLGIPLHIMFTMPWSPTVAFPHPLANIISSTTDERRSNFVSYALVEALTWQGLGRTINRFRQKTLFLEPLGDLSGPAIATRLRIPHTYCWSPALIPKPRDWEKHISISGFCFLDQKTNYTPDPALAAFLAAGPPPVYIGFGSIVVDDPDGLTKTLFAAIEKTGVRALVSKGWGGLGKSSLYVPDNVYMLGNVPHDWLFQHVSCVIHHGGAGTTSTGIALGKPTVIVPFFGDQPFWGSMVAKAGAGPSPIPYKELTADRLADAIMTALEPASVAAAKELAHSITSEQGSKTAAEEFHRALEVDGLRCDLASKHTAVWRVRKTDVKLSAFAAKVLSDEGLLDLNDLKLYHARDYCTERGSSEPISGGLGAILGAVGNLMLGMIDIPIDVAKAVIDKSPGVIPKDSARPSPNPTGEETEPLAFPSPSQASSSGTEKRVPSFALQRPDSKTEKLEDGSQELLHPAHRTPSVSQAGSDHNSLYSVTTRDDPAPSEASIQSEARAEKKSTKTKVMRKITAGKAFGFGFLKEFSGSESVARSTFLKDTTGSIENHPEGSIGSDAALGAGKGLGRMAVIAAKVPVQFAMGITTGFNNAPKMYGDTTTRPTQKVTGINSGIQAATKGLGYGVYDGVTGIFTQPVRGAREEGVAGFFKGVGRGLGGSVLKPGAAIFGIAGYTLKGTWEELQKHFDAGLQSYLIAVRRAEGVEVWQNASLEERADVVQRWGDEVASQKAKAKTGRLDRWETVQRSRKEWKQAQKKSAAGEGDVFLL